MMVFKRRKEFKKQAHRILRLARISDGILKGDDCQTVWAEREGVSVVQIHKDFKEIFANMLAVAKRSVRGKRVFRVRQLEAVLVEAWRSFGLSKRVVYDCTACKGEGYLKNKGACTTCQGEGYIERYDNPGDNTWLRVVNETVKEIAKIEGLHTKSIPPPKKPKLSLHLHANASDPWEYASDEEVIQRRVLMDKLQRRMNGDGVKVIDVKKEENDA